MTFHLPAYLAKSLMADKDMQRHTELFLGTPSLDDGPSFLGETYHSPSLNVNPYFVNSVMITSYYVNFGIKEYGFIQGLVFIDIDSEGMLLLI